MNIVMFQNNLAVKSEFFSSSNLDRKSYRDNTTVKRHQNLNRNFLSAYEKGISSERIAAKLLRSEGYEILGHRIRTGYGEIDLLAQKEHDIVAVEVKRRRTLSEAKSCITFRQQRRIIDALSFIASQRNKQFENYRIDVVCLDAVGRFEHIENAFSVENLVAC